MDKKITKKYIITSVFVVLLAAVFSAGFLFGQSSRPSIEEVGGLTNKRAGQPVDVDFSLFWDAWRAIEEKYVGRFDLNRHEMVYGAISGLLKSLDDPYSVFLKPTESKRFIDDMGGSFEGIGAEIGIRKGVLTIISPLEGNPAQAAGLMPGDKVLKIGETVTTDLTLDEAVELIRGPEGTEVALLIARDNWNEAREIKIVRQEIIVPVIEWREVSLDEESGRKAAYIQLYHFTESSGSEFKKVIREALNINPSGLILDLRNNPGGFLEMAVYVAGYFMPKGEIVVIEDFGNGEGREIYRSGGANLVGNIPVVVLINEGSASASEIVAGALKGRSNMTVVGQKSFGKGSVQQLEKLKMDASIKITVAKWLTPSGVSISDEGVAPDIGVEMTAQDVEEMRDPQMDKAIEVLKNN